MPSVLSPHVQRFLRYGPWSAKVGSKRAPGLLVLHNEVTPGALAYSGFNNLGVLVVGVLRIRALLIWGLNWGPWLSQTPISWPRVFGCWSGNLRVSFVLEWVSPYLWC